MPSTKIKFWGLSTCIHCEKAKRFLDDHGYAYDLTYVDRLTGDERTQTIAEIKKHNASLSFPTILVGDKVVVGFNESELKTVLGI
ncbi:glutaredoxin [Desulfovibrio sp. X2]|uniref:glutaredoxin family protein n=1 Tax=Desulfovibrio sp. X2 TaxID=941449 RepID=UPI000358C185|nr:glutaredoxin family protein [Desulfovibrio sp. X2]EPR44795.1 glutaredoxin [Desulfovibrio sp. X2]